MQSRACLIIERGEPYEAGTRLELPTYEFYLGRSSHAHQVDASFSNFLISRKHCCLMYRENELILWDLGSKHGTILNGKVIVPYEKYLLKNGDKISLSMGIVDLRIATFSQNEETMDLSQTQSMSLKKDLSIALDCAKWECRIDGQPVFLAEKEWNFFKLLYDHTNTVVTYNEIRSAVWPERILSENSSPDVGVDEINVLIYRVRKKLGKRGEMLKAVRARGYMLEIK
ncbi:FHA domain-containing protein [Pelosinus sp. sgz500959]|uniref:FHA domain-containing protein n=1 Tax=Pelosinus sp. sgz500959 TaxID=3242472 RepID=UPI00366F254D